MLFEDNDTRKQIRRAPQNQIERARKHPQFAKERVQQFISDLHEMNGDEVLAVSLEHVMKLAEQLPIEEGKRMRAEEQLEGFCRHGTPEFNHKILRHRSIT